MCRMAWLFSPEKEKRQLTATWSGAWAERRVRTREDADNLTTTQRARTRRKGWKPPTFARASAAAEKERPQGHPGDGGRGVRSATICLSLLSSPDSGRCKSRACAAGLYRAGQLLKRAAAAVNVQRAGDLVKGFTRRIVAAAAKPAVLPHACRSCERRKIVEGGRHAGGGIASRARNVSRTFGKYEQTVPSRRQENEIGKSKVL